VFTGACHRSLSWARWFQLLPFYPISLTLKTQWVLHVPLGLTFENPMFCPYSVFMRFVWIWEQTVTFALHRINWLVFVTDI
jgi:hypothetical protein